MSVAKSIWLGFYREIATKTASNLPASLPALGGQALSKDEARRIAANIAKLPEPPKRKGPALP